MISTFLLRSSSDTTILTTSFNFKFFVQVKHKMKCCEIRDMISRNLSPNQKFLQFTGEIDGNAGKLGFQSSYPLNSFDSCLELQLQKYLNYFVNPVLKKVLPNYNQPVPPARSRVTIVVIFTISFFIKKQTNLLKHTVLPLQYAPLYYAVPLQYAVFNS